MLVIQVTNMEQLVVRKWIGNNMKTIVIIIHLLIASQEIGEMMMIYPEVNGG